MEAVDIAAGPVRLRQFRASDAAELCRIVTIPAVGRMLFRFPAAWSEAEAAAFLDACVFRGARPFRLAIVDHRDRMIGSVGVHHGDEPEIYYFLAPAADGRGTMTAALRAFVAFLFARFPIPALTAEVFTDNPASARILGKLGFLRTGEGTGISLQRLEPAAVWKYRLTREAFGA